MNAGHDAIDAGIAGEAAQWLVRLHSGRFSDADREACERWRARSPEHDRAWLRAQAVLARFDGLPPGLGRAALEATRARRAAVLKLGALIALAPAGWAGWRLAPPTWRADLATATGERRELTLPDGSALTLDTASAVDLDYGAERRLLVLRQGALMLRTAHGDARPLLVQSAQGTVQALGTVFTVRQFDGRTRVGVVEGQVRLAPRAGAARTLATGLSADFDAAGVAEPNVPAHPPQAWAEGVLYADDWRLDDMVRELGRYRAGILRCDPAVAGLRLSGAFQLDDTDAALLAVARSLPVSVVYRTRYWVTLTAA